MQKYAELAVAEHMSEVQQKFFAHWKGKNPWRDANGREIKDFIEKIAEKSDTYKQFEELYGKNSDSIRIMVNKKIKDESIFLER